MLKLGSIFFIYIINLYSAAPDDSAITARANSPLRTTLDGKMIGEAAENLSTQNHHPGAHHAITLDIPHENGSTLLKLYIPELCTESSKNNAVLAFQSAQKSVLSKVDRITTMPTVNPRLLESALSTLLDQHPHRTPILDHISLMLHLMHHMQKDSDAALKDRDYLKSITKNPHSLRNFLREVVETVKTNIIKKTAPSFFRDTCNTIVSLMQVDFSRIETGKTVHPVTLLETVGALSQGIFLFDLARFDKRSFPSLCKYHAFLSGIKALKTCATTIVHIDTLLDNPYISHEKSLYLTLIQSFGTNILQQVVDRHAEHAPHKIYLYVAELCLQAHCLGNIPGIYTAQIANPTIDEQSVPQHIAALLQKLGPHTSICDYAHADSVEDFEVDVQQVTSPVYIKDPESIENTSGVNSIISTETSTPNEQMHFVTGDYLTPSLCILKKDLSTQHPPTTLIYMFTPSTSPSHIMESISKRAVEKAQQGLRRHKISCNVFATPTPTAICKKQPIPFWRKLLTCVCLQSSPEEAKHPLLQEHPLHPYMDREDVDGDDNPIYHE